MFDGIERRRFLIDPARENALPAAVGLLHVQLDERSGQPLIVPRRAGFAGAQANDRILDAQRLTRLQRQVADDAIALVEEAQHRDPLAHWRDRGGSSGARGIDGHRRCRRRIALGGAIACTDAKRDQQDGDGATHVQSGFHAW